MIVICVLHYYFPRAAVDVWIRVIYRYERKPSIFRLKYFLGYICKCGNENLRKYCMAIGISILYHINALIYHV